MCSLQPTVQHPVTSSELHARLLSVYEEKNHGGVWALSPHPVLSLLRQQRPPFSVLAIPNWGCFPLLNFTVFKGLFLSLVGLRLTWRNFPRTFLSWHCLPPPHSYLIDLSFRYKLFLSLNERLLAAFSNGVRETQTELDVLIWRKQGEQFKGTWLHFHIYLWFDSYL